MACRLNPAHRTILASSLEDYQKLGMCPMKNGLLQNSGSLNVDGHGLQQHRVSEGYTAHACHPISQPVLPPDSPTCSAAYTWTCTATIPNLCNYLIVDLQGLDLLQLLLALWIGFRRTLHGPDPAQGLRQV